MKTILLSFIFCLIHACLGAQPGTLDSSFGENGIFISKDSAGYTKVALQHSDKIILCGGKMVELNVSPFLTRHNTDGSLDSLFGENGYSIHNYSLYNAEFNSLNVLSDDKIIAAGLRLTSLLSSPGGTNIVIAKFNPDGALDSTFGDNGYIKYYFDYFEYPNSIAIQSDNKIVIAGAHSPDIYEDTGFVMRLLPNGGLDSSFGINGQVRLKEAAWLSSVAIQKDDKIVVGGYGLFNSEFFVGRLNADGTYDTTFGKIGYVYTRFTNHLHDGVSSIVLQPDQKIVATGPVNENNAGTEENMGAARYNINGTLDSAFGINGLSIIKFNTLSAAENIFLQGDGNFILTGYVFSPFFGFDTLAIVKLKSNDNPDSSFGVNGKVVTGLIVNGSSASALQKDSKIILAGANDSTDFIARYNNSENKKQIIINKIKHYISTHNNADAVTLNKNITLYPNPVNNLLTIKGLSPINNYQLIINNSKGSVVASKQVNNVTSYQFNVQNISSGVYYVNVVANNKIVNTLKFVKE